MYNLLVNTANILAEPADSGKSGGMPQWIVWVFLAVVVALLFVWIFFSNRKNKQRQQEYVEQLDAIAPGNKVKTAGGICGIVVEVCDDNTVIIKTGSESSGYSFVKMEKELIAQTDAKGATQLKREEAEEKKRLEKEAKSGTEVATEESEAPAQEEATEEKEEEKSESGDKDEASDDKE